MSAPSLSTEAGLAKGYPSNRFNDRERQLLSSVKTYVDASAAAQNALSELTDVAIATPSSGQVLIYDGTNSWDNKTMSGDATIAASGALTIAALAVSSGKLAADAVSDASKIADDAVSLEHLDAGIEYSHRVFAAGEFTTLGGDAAESITAVGALATDLAFVVLKTPGAAPVTILNMAAGVDSIAVNFSADPSTDHVVTWQLMRASA